MVERGRENSGDCDAMRRFLTIRRILFLVVAGVCGGKLYGSSRESLRAETAAQAAAQSNDTKEWFTRGQAALQSGNLDSAEKAFRNVLAADPNSGGAYANLGVIEMRRKNTPPKKGGGLFGR